MRTALTPMPMTNTSKTMTLLVQRQLDAITTGNGAFLETFLRTAKAAGFRVRIVFAPSHPFIHVCAPSLMRSCGKAR